jgi:hypothetical protein
LRHPLIQIVFRHAENTTERCLKALHLLFCGCRGIKFRLHATILLPYWQYNDLMSCCGNISNKTAAFVLLFTPVALFCTTVAVVRTPSRIIIASDSLSIENGSKGKACKIGTNSLFPISFAAAGSVAFNDFSAIPLARNAISNNPTLASVADTLVWVSHLY